MMENMEYLEFQIFPIMMDLLCNGDPYIVYLVCYIYAPSMGYGIQYKTK